jgi:hypothetical protein
MNDVTVNTQGQAFAAVVNAAGPHNVHLRERSIPASSERRLSFPLRCPAALRPHSAKPPHSCSTPTPAFHSASKAFGSAFPPICSGYDARSGSARTARLGLQKWATDTEPSREARSKTALAPQAQRYMEWGESAIGGCRSGRRVADRDRRVACATHTLDSGAGVKCRVSRGRWPEGRKPLLRRRRNATWSGANRRLAAADPAGESPTGTGGSPVLPTRWVGERA